MGVVKEKNAAQIPVVILGAAGRAQLGVISGEVLPVMAVHGPEDDAHPEILRNLERVRVKIPIGGPEIGGACPKRTEDRIGGADFLLLDFGRKRPQIGVRPGVVANFVPFRNDAAHHGGVAFRIAAQEKEGGRDTVAAQHVEQVASVTGGAVIKGEGAEILAHALVHDAVAVDDRSRGAGCGEGKKGQGQDQAPCARGRHVHSLRPCGAKN